MGVISGLAGIEVLIGLSFVFFLLSTACSAIQEGIASVLGWRAKTLEDAVANMLGNPKIKRGAKEWFGIVHKLGPKERRTKLAHDAVAIPADLASAVFDHWRIRALVRDPTSTKRRRTRPSYVPRGALSLAVAETLADSALAPEAAPGPAPQGGEQHVVAATRWQRTDDEILAGVRTALRYVPLEHPREVLQKAAANSHDDLERFRAHVETAFDDSMERATGWYKRKVQLMLAVLALAFAVGLNVNAVTIATHLYNDEAVRTAVVGQVNAADPQTAAKSVADVKQLQLPVGWGADNAPSSFSGVLSSIPGWLVTIAALNLGAPFWFDVLSRLSRQRGAGVPDAPKRALSDKPPDDSDDDDEGARARPKRT